MKWTSQRRALLTVGGALTLSLVLASPASAAVEWDLQYELDRAEENEFVDVAAAAADDVWAVGSVGPWDDTKPVAFHYDGDSWREIESPQVGVEFTGIDATSSGTAWLAVDDTDDSGGDDG
ncbi:MAG: hypothetical protein GEV07_25480 [Streptosporangiales bacterium]|nr:hypothetical protein [Streptosporangiales bacterium]